MHRINRTIFCIIFTCFIFLFSNGQTIKKVKVLSRGDLFDTCELNFKLDYYCLSKQAVKVPLFDIPISIYDQFHEFEIEVNLKARYCDTNITIPISGHTYNLFAQFDSVPTNLWILRDSIGIIRCEFFFNIGKLIFINFYDENGKMLRSIFYKDTLFLDKWYYNENLIRVTLIDNKYKETKVYYPDGKMLFELKYNEKGRFKEGLHFNYYNGDISSIVPTGG